MFGVKFLFFMLRVFVLIPFAYLELKMLSCCMFRVIIITVFVYFNF